MLGLILFVFVLAACIAIIWGRKAGQDFIGCIAWGVGLIVMFVLGIGVTIYFIDKRDRANAAAKPAPQVTHPASTLPEPSVPAPPAQQTYQPTWRMCEPTATCTSCGGTGDGSPPYISKDGLTFPNDCARCNGLGLITCPRCNGNGQRFY